MEFYPNGYLCGEKPGFSSWLCRSDLCHLSQLLDLSRVFTDVISIQISTKVIAATSMWPTDYASLNITVILWNSDSEEKSMWTFPTGLQMALQTNLLSPIGVCFI
eukprot:TRINITY_DN11493_c0_g1_i8.p1 TRINITY_DN11493_c0_g1~~TRINITY_DN11493_c0_g1_i8.p1  ORF type:complete len:105 (-),score=13.75 TRINITY_DN11493_c0_g1_i8:1133-1447(-)